MRHRVKTKKIGKDLKHKKAILKNLTLAFFLKERIKTSLVKAKIFRSYVEKIITRAKEDTLHNRREVYKKIRNTKVLKNLFLKIAPRYKNRKGGYTKIYKLGRRKGDGSEMALIELMPEIIQDNLEDNKKIEPINSKAESQI